MEAQTLFRPCLAETFANARFLEGFMTYDLVEICHTMHGSKDVPKIEFI